MEMNTCCDVMCDIETTGTSPDENAILQIAAVKFNIRTRDVDPNFFNMNLTMPPKRFWDESTRHWWMQQDPAVWDAITTNPQEPSVVLQAFADWAGYHHPEPLRFWAKPTSFDFTFVQSYFKQFGVAFPFHYRNAVDLNSFIRGRTLRMDLKEIPEIDLPFEGDAHNGIYDCIHQIKIAFAGASL
jgi:DNA polymerase III alpha subunit (gram-positive type)